MVVIIKSESCNYLVFLCCRIIGESVKSQKIILNLGGFSLFLCYLFLGVKGISPDPHEYQNDPKMNDIAPIPPLIYSN